MAQPDEGDAPAARSDNCVNSAQHAGDTERDYAALARCLLQAVGQKPGSWSGVEKAMSSRGEPETAGSARALFLALMLFISYTTIRHFVYLRLMLRSRAYYN